MDVRQICVEEIALEGLDGITLPALWLRMNHRKPKLPYAVSDKLHDYLWRFVLDQPAIRVVQIPKPRDDPHLFERTTSLDEQRVPIATAPDELDTIVEVYSTSAVRTDDAGIRGCCSNYSERIDIKHEIMEHSLDLTASFAKYGRQRIVVVASQSMREHAMLSGNLSRVLLEDLSDYCYCVLELIARSRWEGVIMSRLSKMDFPHKAFHAIVKKLHILGLVTKCHHSYKVSADSRVCGQVLVNLTKYERTSLPLSARVMKGILEELQNAPNHTMNLGVLKEKFNADAKPFKSSYQMLKKTGEITISGVHPGKQMRSVYEMIATLADKQDEDDEDDPEPAVDNDDLVLMPLALKRPYLSQAYDFIKRNAARGVCQADMQRFLKGFGTLDARYVLKSLLQKKVVDVVLFDKGKQRIRMYIPKTVSTNCSKSKEFIAEKKKMQELVLSTKLDDTTQDGNVEDAKPADNVENAKTKGGRKSKFEKLSSSADLTARAETTHLKKWDANLTARTIKRHNVVLEHVNREKIVTGFVTIRKLINTAGKMDGDTSNVDHHSVTRLVEKMKASGVLKHDEVPITYKDVTETFHFIRSLDCPDALFESAIDQARFKHIGREENRIARQDQKMAEKHKREVSKKKDETPEENQENPYFQPRFKRLRLLHEFMWYLAYAHPLSDTFSNDNSEADTPKVYDPEFTWKRYLPPAPLHSHGGRNWLQVGELVLIMPLSLLCKFYRPCRITDELEEYLQDADKCHMLVRHLPPGIKCILLGKRKYIYSLTECVHQLFFMGLVTMKSTVVSSRCMPKESMMLYVHRNVTVVDTRTSRSGYMKVEEKDYEKIQYRLDDSQVLESFWYKLQAICMQTKLGSYQYMEGEAAKSHLCSTVVKDFVKSSSETVQEPRDDGHIPGDGLGAGGLDSSLFSFLYRNWYAFQARKTMKSGNGRKKRQPALAEKRKRPLTADVEVAGEPKPKSRKTALKLSEKPAAVKSRAKPSSNVPAKEIEVVMESNVGRNERVKGGRGVKRKAAPAAPEQPSSSSTLLNLNKVRRRRTGKAQTGGVLKQGKQRIKYLDDVDLEAIKRRNGRIRASFTKSEDALYLLCHVTTSLLVQLYWKKPHPPRKQIIPWSVVRDVMHLSLPESADKTSYSGGRRTHILMKNPETRICHDISVADIKSDNNFLAEFCPPELDLEGDSARVREVYCKLVEQLKKRFKSQPGLFEDEIPDTSEQLLKLYVPKTIICKSGDIVPRRCYFDDTINDALDVRKSVAENMIYIALAMSDSEFSIFQAYRAFEEFPESTLKDVFSKMKLGGYACRKRHQYRKVPYAMRMYRLTHAHHLSLKAPVPMTVVDKVSQGLGQGDDFEIKTVTTLDHVFLSSYFMTKKALDIEVDIPDDVVVPEALNSSVFENQFRSMLQGAEKDLLKEVRDLQTTDNDASTVPPDSLMAAAACILKEDFDDDAKKGENPEASSDAADRKLKIAELMRLYHRHPSYSNWLILIKPNSKRSESKFSALNFSSTSDCIVLTPCTIKIRNVRAMIDRHCNVDPSERVTSVNNLLRSKPVNIERSETEWARRNRKVDAHGIVARAVFESVDGAGYAGITRRELFESVRFDEKSVNACLDKLFEKRVLYSVGIEEIRVVSYKNVTPWVAKGFRYKDGNRNFQNEILYELELFQPDKSDEAKKKEDSKEEAPKALRAEGERLQSKYEAVEFICRPWHNLCGEISFASAKSLLTSVFMKVYSSPGVTQDAICASLSYQRVVVVELLGVLRATGCVREMCVDCPGLKRLFGAPSPAKTVVYYEATDDGLVIVSQWTTVADKMISLSGAASEER